MSLSTFTVSEQYAHNQLAKFGSVVLDTTISTDRNLLLALIQSGDCGNWDPESDAEVIGARAAIAKAEGGAA